MPSEFDPNGMAAARQKGRAIAGHQPGALVEAFAEVAAAGAAAYVASVAEAEPKPIGYVNVYRDEDGDLELGAIDVYPEPEPELAEFADNFVGVGALYLAAHPAPSGMGVKVKALDLSNLLRHAFISGVEAIGGTTSDGIAEWPAYNPEECPAFDRIRSALIPPAGSDAGEVATIAEARDLDRREAFKAGWWTNAAYDQPADYLESCEDVDFAEFHKKGLDAYVTDLLAAAREENDATSSPPGSDADWKRIDDALVSCASLIRALSYDDVAEVAAAELDYARSVLAQSPTVGEITEEMVERAKKLARQLKGRAGGTSLRTYSDRMAAEDAEASVLLAALSAAALIHHGDSDATAK